MEPPASMLRSKRFRRDAGLLAVALGVLLFALFAPYLAGGKTLMVAARDVSSAYPTGAVAAPRGDGSTGPIALVQKTYDYSSGWLFEPASALEHRLVFEQHVLPMWDPYDGYGAPFAAAMQPQPFAPFAFALSAHPSPLAYDWYLILRLYLAGLGAALLCRVFAGFWPSLVAGVTAALSSYFLIYYDMPHLSVEVLLPGFLLAIEAVARRASPARMFGLAVIAAMTVLGGMPESTVLVWAVAVPYAAVRMIALRERPHALRRCAVIAASLALGAALSAVVVLPFVEYLGVAVDAHQTRNVGTALPGLLADRCMPSCLPTVVSPLAFGPPWNDLRTGFFGPNGTEAGFGLVAIWLAAIAVTGALRRAARRAATGTDGIAVLFAILIAVFEGKRYGFEPLQWIGRLPIFDLIIYTKYVEAEVGVMVALLAGFGLRQAVLAIVRGGTFVVADLGTAALAAFACTIGFDQIPEPTRHAWYFYVSFATALLAFAAALGTRAAARAGVVTARRAAAAIALLAIGQAAALYAIPMFYKTSPPADASANPFREPPYLAATKNDVARGYRVFGTEDMLHADWAGAFGVPSVTATNAVYPAAYLRFVSSFGGGGKELEFVGSHHPDLGSPLGRRFLRLSSVAAVIAPAGAPAPAAGDLTSRIVTSWASVARAHAANVRLDTTRIDGKTERSIFEHPPLRDLTVTVNVPRDRSRMTADIGIVPDAYLTHECAAAVRFTLSAEAAGRTVASTSRAIDPKAIVEDRRWIPVSLDLRAFAGRAVTLRFATAGVADEVCNGWAEWGDPRFVDERGRSAARPDPLHVVWRDADATVMRFDEPMERATVFRDVRLVADDDAVYAALAAPVFEEARTALVVRGDAGGLPRFAPCGVPDRVSTSFPRADEVTIDARLGCAGLLMLNDTFYPGWRAWVDGVETKIVRTDGLFRGIAVGAGHHAVRFAYASPVVARGLAISLAALACLVVLVLAAAWGRVRRGRA